jgi:uncharacterized protein DUF4439
VTDVEALQTTLAAEHAAVWVYGLLGGRTSAAATPELYRSVFAAYAGHRSRRDQLVRILTERGEAPVAAEPAYEVSGPVNGPQRVAAVALETEEACAATYAWLVANTVAEERRWAIGALNEAAVRELAFRGTPEMFPGAGEHADR